MTDQAFKKELLEKLGHLSAKKLRRLHEDLDWLAGGSLEILVDDAQSDMRILECQHEEDVEDFDNARALYLELESEHGDPRKYKAQEILVKLSDTPAGAVIRIRDLWPMVKERASPVKKQKKVRKPTTCDLYLDLRNACDALDDLPDSQILGKRALAEHRERQLDLLERIVRAVEGLLLRQVAMSEIEREVHEAEDFYNGHYGELSEAHDRDELTPKQMERYRALPGYFDEIDSLKDCGRG